MRTDPSDLLSRFIRPLLPLRQGLIGIAALASLVTPVIVHAQHQCSAVSPENRVALIELYTSEGCSSCPPADKWLSALSESALSAKQVLPLAMHVDYWDYIGWKDRFADPRYTKRQRERAANNRLRGIYTPQVVTAGQDTRDWYRAGSFLARVKTINAERAPLRIQLSASDAGVDSRSVRVNVELSPVGSPGNLPERANVHVMIYENDLSSEVSRGENAGERLTHDRVVRAWARPHSLTQALTGSADYQRTIDLPSDVRIENVGVAAFIEDAGGAIVQATECRLRQSS